VKIKFYTHLLIGISLAIAGTNSYAKSSHAHVKKHVVIIAKRVKKDSRNTASHTKHAHKTHVTHLASAASKRSAGQRKSHLLRVSHSRKKHSSFIARKSSHIENVQDEELTLQPTASNTRIHSLIGSQDQVVADDTTAENEAPVQDETPLHLVSTHGIINSSLYVAGQNAGLSGDLIMQLTSIFAWDIDFANNLHRGDQFTVVYENNGQSSSQIVAAEFVTQGKILTAVRYKDKLGNVNYYSPEGKTMRKAFLSTPVDYDRISSHFDTHRRHPILNRIRAHKGVDYAARTGTPVKAAGDGKITFLGRKGGYGQVMIIGHGEHYETLYAHLSDFKHGLEAGDSVRQGEVIAYVGQTGLATGPHLHYEFRVDGEHRNPEALNQEHSLPLGKHLLANFKSQARPLLAQLYQTKARTLFAKSQYGSNTDQE